MIALAVCRDLILAVYREVALGDRAEPDIVIALAVADERAAVIAQQSANIALVIGHQSTIAGLVMRLVCSAMI